ncbi:MULTISPECIES: DciA family protein [unclassified Thioalkalivibrio]|uniref:DciA family protein n=1 Tax=unclassified Thioalkalivibrio TaxID=2621013 RepID=UPI00037DE72D|nr:MULTISPECIES: DciA family protein [unclassified Thioalkalivibrio]
MMPRHANRFVAANLSVHSDRDRELERALAPVVGEELRRGRLALTRQGETLIAVCADRPLATEIRFQQRELLKTLAAAGIDGTTEVRIRLDSTPRAPQPKPVAVQREIPESARSLLMQTARSISDPELAGALERLAALPPQGR